VLILNEVFERFFGQNSLDPFKFEMGERDIGFPFGAFDIIAFSSQTGLGLDFLMCCSNNVTSNLAAGWLYLFLVMG